MIKINNWSMLGFIGSILFTLISITRYWFQYQDIDRFIAYTIIGILIFAVSWLYNSQKNQGNTLEALEEYIVDK